MLTLLFSKHLVSEITATEVETKNTHAGLLQKKNLNEIFFLVEANLNTNCMCKLGHSFTVAYLNLRYSTEKFGP